MTTTSLLPEVGIELREGYAEVGDAELHYVEAGDGPLIVLPPTSTASSENAVPSPRCWSVTIGADPSPGRPR